MKQFSEAKLKVGNNSGGGKIYIMPHHIGIVRTAMMIRGGQTLVDPHRPTPTAPLFCVVTV